MNYRIFEYILSRNKSYIRFWPRKETESVHWVKFTEDSNLITQKKVMKNQQKREPQKSPMEPNSCKASSTQHKTKRLPTSNQTAHDASKQNKHYWRKALKRRLQQIHQVPIFRWQPSIQIPNPWRLDTIQNQKTNLKNNHFWTPNKENGGAGRNWTDDLYPKQIIFCFYGFLLAPESLHPRDWSANPCYFWSP